MKQQSAGKQTPSSSGIPSNGSSATHLAGIATPQWRAPARGSRGEWARGSASPRPPPSELASVCRWSAALGAERSGTGGGRWLLSLAAPGQGQDARRTWLPFPWCVGATCALPLRSAGCLPAFGGKGARGLVGLFLAIHVRPAGTGTKPKCRNMVVTCYIWRPKFGPEEICPIFK